MDAIFGKPRLCYHGFAERLWASLTDIAKFNGTLQTNNMIDRDTLQMLYSSFVFYEIQY